MKILKTQDEALNIKRMIEKGQCNEKTLFHRLNYYKFARHVL